MMLIVQLVKNAQLEINTQNVLDLLKSAYALLTIIITLKCPGNLIGMYNIFLAYSGIVGLHIE